jgi:DNA repair exonuclease SbcCD nuclease subunit
MSENVLLFSDIHIHTHKKRNDRLEDCLKVLQWVFDVAKENNVENILFGGDLFHDRVKIPIYTYHKTFEVLKKNIDGHQLYLLYGNHDLWYSDKTSASSVLPFSGIPNVHVIDCPQRHVISGCTWDFIPYTKDPIETLEKLEQMPGTFEYALGHIAVDGAILHRGKFSEEFVEHDGDMVRISPTLFNKYKHTFLGHYHVPQKVTEFLEYIGSPLQLEFSEAFQKKHCILFDGKKNIKTYIENNFSPKHYVINASEKDKYDLTGHFVKLIVDSDSQIDVLSIKKEISEKYETGSLQIKHQKTESSEHVIADAKAILNNEEMLKEYVLQVGNKNLNEDLLVKIGEKCQRKIQQ